MALFHGDITKLTRIAGAQFYYEDGLLGIFEQQYEIRKDLAFSKAPQDQAAHPSYPAFKHDKKRMKIKFNETTAVLTCYYVSNEAPNGDESSSLEPIYELIGNLSQEALETNPDFVDVIGGTKDAPLNSAIFDSNGRFLGFPPDAGNELGGIRSFLNPQLTWRETKFKLSSTLDSIASMGKIHAPAGGAPTLPTPRNWLLTSFSQRRQGNNYQQTREWRSSGPRGWNSLLYS